MQIEINKEEEKKEEKEEETNTTREIQKLFFLLLIKRKFCIIHNLLFPWKKDEENIFERVNSLPILEQPDCPWLRCVANRISLKFNNNPLTAGRGIRPLISIKRRRNVCRAEVKEFLRWPQISFEQPFSSHIFTYLHIYIFINSALRLHWRDNISILTEFFSMNRSVHCFQTGCIDHFHR